MVDYSFFPVGDHLSDTTISGVTTLDVPASLQDKDCKLLIQATGQDVRLTLHGTAPSNVLGFKIKADDPPVMIFVSRGVTVIKVIEETASAVIQYQWGE